tara:strand:+ start:128 stop:373 length:246 start_codon:yes stop_codon:yes gene_type:complete
MPSKSTNYYKSHADALKIKQEYQREYNKSPTAKKKRAALNKENRKRGTYGNGDNLDVSHKKGGGTKLEVQSKNRARNRGKA